MFCGDRKDEWRGKQDGYLIVNKRSNDGHVHVHGTIDDKDTMKELIDSAIHHSGLEDSFNASSSDKVLPKEIIFHNRQRIGDILMFTCAIRDFKKAYPDIKVNVISTAGHIWDYNPNIDRTIAPWYKEGKAIEKITSGDLLSGNTNVVKIGPGKLTNMSNRLDWHFANAFRISIEDELKIKFQQGAPRPDIWLTKEEFNAPRVTDKPYWLIVIGGEKGWGCKMYPFERWQEFVNQNPDTLFYQLGAKEDSHPRLQGDNIVDYVGMTQDKDTGIRDLFKLFLNAEGSIGLVSFHMHLSAAFGKPCIVVAGAREPVSFTRYPGHQYLATDGCLPCADNTACWHCDIKVCPRLIVDETKKELLDRKIPQCVDLIKPKDLTRALNMYYEGGRLKKGVVSPKPKFKNIVETPKFKEKTTKSVTVYPTVIDEAVINMGSLPQTTDGKFIKFISTARGWGGCGRSIATIMKFLLKAGYKVEFIPFRNKVSCSELKSYIKEYLQGLIITENYSTVHDPCDILFMYSDDYVWEFNKPEIIETFSNLHAKKKILMANYRRGGIGEIEWTKGWDKYMFLNSTQEKDLLSVLPGVKTKVLPPCTELDMFLPITPDYGGALKIVRHNSQGDVKFEKNFADEVNAILDCRSDVTIDMLPGPTFVPESDRFKKVKRTASPYSIAEFLGKGSLFWYSLPQGYMDMGPRVILEAMAAGLPILADNWGGATDRVTPECGWLCDTKQQMVDIIKDLTSEELKRKGEAAKEKARTEFISERWIEEILNI